MVDSDENKDLGCKADDYHHSSGCAAILNTPLKGSVPTDLGFRGKWPLLVYYRFVYVRTLLIFNAESSSNQQFAVSCYRQIFEGIVDGCVCMC